MIGTLNLLVIMLSTQLVLYSKQGANQQSER